MRWGCLTSFCLLLLMALSACSDDDTQYPPVQLEFLTATAGSAGNLQSVRTDEGICLPIREDHSRLRIDASSSARIVGNYERFQVGDGTEAVKLYAALKAVAPLPKPVADFKEGVQTESASVSSIWMGYDYLNVLLSVKQAGKHVFHFVEEELTHPDADGVVTLRVLLYHAVEEGTADYSKRVYASVPLRQYVTPDVRKVKVFFSLHTDAQTDEPYVKPDVENLEVKTYSFDYIPR